MSLMNKQVKDLRNLEILVAQLQDKDIAMLLRDAADTIETFVTPSEWIMEKIHSVEPKQGKWIKSHTGTIAEGYFCTNCGKRGHREDFCPNCGAKMKGVDDGEMA